MAERFAGKWVEEEVTVIGSNLDELTEWVGRIDRRLVNVESFLAMRPMSPSPFQLLLPSIMSKTAAYMKVKYKRVPEATHVHDLTRCSLKRELEERYPELAERVLFEPAVQIGEALHTFAETLPTIDKAQAIFERRVNRHLVVGKPDVTTAEAVYDFKFRRRLYDRPLDHDVLTAMIYAWLAEKPYAHIIYFNPVEFREWVVPPATTELVLYLIEHPVSPRWKWECRICPFKTVCPKAVVKRSKSSNPNKSERCVHGYLRKLCPICKPKTPARR